MKMIVAGLFLILMGQASAESILEVRLSQADLETLVNIKLPYREKLYHASGWLGSITIHAEVRSANIDLSQGRIDAVLPSIIFDEHHIIKDSESIETTIDASIQGHKLTLKARSAYWDIDINPGGLTGDINLGKVDFSKLVPELATGITVDLPEELSTALGVTWKIKSYSIRVAENFLIIRGSAQPHAP